MNSICLARPYVEHLSNDIASSLTATFKVCLFKSLCTLNTLISRYCRLVERLWPIAHVNGHKIQVDGGGHKAATSQPRHAALSYNTTLVFAVLLWCGKRTKEND